MRSYTRLVATDYGKRNVSNGILRDSSVCPKFQVAVKVLGGVGGAGSSQKIKKKKKTATTQSPVTSENV